MPDSLLHYHTIGEVVARLRSGENVARGTDPGDPGANRGPGRRPEELRHGNGRLGPGIGPDRRAGRSPPGTTGAVSTGCPSSARTCVSPPKSPPWAAHRHSGTSYPTLAVLSCHKGQLRSIAKISDVRIYSPRVGNLRATRAQLKEVLAVHSNSFSFRFLMIATFVLIYTVAVVGCGGPSDTPIPTPVPLSITAIDLYAAKQSNEADWNLNYVDRRALIFGEVTSVEKSGSKYDVKIAAERKTSSTVNPFTAEYTGADIVCKVDESLANTVTRIEQGHELTVLATISDDGFVDLVVKDCTVQ